MVTGFSLAAVVVVWLGMSNYLEKGQYYVAYFDESVQGLDKDSPVKYRGVTIGSVHAIGVAPDANLIQVVLKIETDIQLDDSIVAQLKSVGITGIMFVELEKRVLQDHRITPTIDFPTKYPIIRTKPSDIKQFFDTVTDVLVEFKKLDIEGISTHIQSTLSRMEKAIDDAHIDKLAHDLNAMLSGIQAMVQDPKWQNTLASLEQAAEGIQSFSRAGTRAAGNFDASLNRIDGTVAESEKALRRLLSDINASIQQLDAIVQSSKQFIESTHKETERLLPQLRNTLRQYEKAGTHLHRFLEKIADQPSQLIRGGPDENPQILQKP